MITPDIIEQAMKQIEESFYTDELSEDDFNLKEQITLGDNWDDPYRLLQALDKQPENFAKWGLLLKGLQRELETRKEILNSYTSEKKLELRSDIYNENIEAGKTANNAEPTSTIVDQRFILDYVSTDSPDEKKRSEYLNFKSKVDEVQVQVDQISIIVKAFEQRQNMLISLGALLGKMIDNRLVFNKKDSTKKPKSAVRNLDDL